MILNRAFVSISADKSVTAPHNDRSEELWHISIFFNNCFEANCFLVHFNDDLNIVSA